jgi:hypothetical protein
MSKKKPPKPVKAKPPKAIAPAKEPLAGGLSRLVDPDDALLPTPPPRNMAGKITIGSSLRTMLQRAKKSGDYSGIREYAERLDIEQQRSPNEPIAAPFQEALNQLPSADRESVQAMLSDLPTFKAMDNADFDELRDATGAVTPIEDTLDPAALAAMQRLNDLYNTQSELRIAVPDFDETPDGRRLQREIERLAQGADLAEMAGPDLTVVEAPSDIEPGPAAPFEPPLDRRLSTYAGREAMQNSKLKTDFEKDPVRELRRIAPEMRDIRSVEEMQKAADAGGVNVDVFSTLPDVVEGTSAKARDAAARKALERSGAESMIRLPGTIPAEANTPTQLGVPLRVGRSSDRIGDLEVERLNRLPADHLLRTLMEATGAKTGSTGALDTLSKSNTGAYSIADMDEAANTTVNLDAIFPQSRGLFPSVGADGTITHQQATADLIARLLTGRIEAAQKQELGSDFVTRITPLIERSLQVSADTRPRTPEARRFLNYKFQPGPQGMRFLSRQAGDNTLNIGGPAPQALPAPPAAPPAMFVPDEMDVELPDLPQSLQQPPPPAGRQRPTPPPLDLSQMGIPEQYGAEMLMGIPDQQMSPLLRRILART